MWRGQGSEPLGRVGLAQVSWQEGAGGSERDGLSVQSYLEEQYHQYPRGVPVGSGWIVGTQSLQPGIDIGS